MIGLSIKYLLSNDWDRFLLNALFGREVRGPLDKLWEASKKSDECFVPFPTNEREVRRDVRVVSEHVKRAQKLWYDQNFRERESVGVWRRSFSVVTHYLQLVAGSVARAIYVGCCIG